MTQEAPACSGAHRSTASAPQGRAGPPHPMWGPWLQAPVEFLLGDRKCWMFTSQFGAYSFDWNNHASLLCSPDWESTPGNIQKDKLLKLPARTHQKQPHRHLQAAHQIFNKAQLCKSSEKALVTALLGNLTSVNGRSTVKRLVLFLSLFAVSLLFRIFLFKPKQKHLASSGAI